MLEGNLTRIKENIALWLDEDIGTGDVTTQTTIPVNHQSKGIIHAKEAGVICGISVAQLVFDTVDPEVSFTAKIEEGSFAAKGTIIAVAEGSTRSILMAERLALNLLQRLSGIATQTKAYVNELEGLPVRLVDTRKTTPGHRILEKYAVRVGGGFNHRFGLYDAVMIKDNHIKASGGISQAVAAARKGIPHTMKIEVEIEHLEQIEEAISGQADIIMLDNMKCSEMAKAVKMIKQAAPHITVEASGGVTKQTVKEIGLTGVDVISVGGLTSSIQSLDISLDLNGKKEGSL
jgi:nicotinate-nucleotide pyrophosphorylase (carboxylating)